MMLCHITITGGLSWPLAQEEPSSDQFKHGREESLRLISSFTTMVRRLTAVFVLKHGPTFEEGKLN